MISKLKRAWQGIGGDEFLRPFYYIPTILPLLIGGIRLSESGEQSFEIVANYLFANSLSLLFVIAVAFLVLKIKRRRKIFFSPLQVVIIALSLGLIKAVTTASLLFWIGAERDLSESITSRLFGASTAALVTIVLISLFGSMLVVYSEDRLKLISKKVIRNQAGISEQILDELDRLLTRMRELRSEAKNTREASAIIRALIKNQLANLDKRIWEKESKKLNSFEIKSLIRETIFREKYPALLIALMLPLVTPIWPAIIEGNLVAIGEEALQVFVIWFGFIFLNQFKTRISDSLLVALSVVVLASISYVAGYLIPVSTGVETATTATLSALFLGAFLPNVAIVFGFAKTFLSNAKAQDKLRLKEEQLLSQKGFESLSQMIRAKSNVGLIHGRIQNLIFLAATQNKNSSSIRTEIDQTLETVRALKSEIDPEQNLDLATLVDKYSPVIKVHMKLGAVELAKRELVVLEEAIANAYRHGMATEIWVEFPEPDVFRVIDNGVGPSDGEKGLGSYLFDSVGEWELKHSKAGGSQLTISVSSELD